MTSLFSLENAGSGLFKLQHYERMGYLLIRMVSSELSREAAHGQLDAYSQR